MEGTHHEKQAFCNRSCTDHGPGTFGLPQDRARGGHHHRSCCDRGHGDHNGKDDQSNENDHRKGVQNAKESKTADKTVIKNDVNLVGTWDDRYSQRATMEVRGGKNNVYRIHIHWGSTAFESEDWTMTGTFNDTTGELTYQDCTRTTITFDEEGNETDEVHYRNGTGKFLYNNGELTWQSDNDDYVDQCVFIQ